MKDVSCSVVKGLQIRRMVQGETREESKRQFKKACVCQTKKRELTLGTLRSYWNILWKDLIWLDCAYHKGSTGSSVEERDKFEMEG